MTSYSNPIDEPVLIDRYVLEVDESSLLDATSRALIRRYNPAKAITLGKLLEADEAKPLVLIAPSGSGKTTELRHHVVRLRSIGRPAVFAEASGIATFGQLELDPDERAALASALGGSDRVLLVVDGLDELYLRQRSIDDLFRCLWRHINFRAQPIRLVFSARNGAWNAYTARTLRRQLAGLETEPKLVTFEPLDDVAIERLAGAFGISDTAKFMSEFKAEEIAQIIDLRPTDVKLLVALSKQPGALRKWSRVLDDFIEASFVEDRVDRKVANTLPPSEAREGLTRVAAASTLMNMPHVSVPTVGVMERAISSTRLFSDWPSGKVGDLFENALFVHKGRQAEAVQLPAGRVTDYLAAQWFATRVQQGLSGAALRDRLLVQVPWSTDYFIPKARRPIVGWLASGVPQLRRLLVGQHPEVVLYEGDPDQRKRSADDVD